MKELYLTRGLPGSGKSTVAQSISPIYMETDMYFMKDGVYKFDVTKIKEAHNWCREKCEDAMKKDLPKIAVSNTFTQEWEMKAYYELAKQYGYVVHSLIVENRHEGENTHGVPEEKIEEMRDRFSVKL